MRSKTSKKDTLGKNRPQNKHPKISLEGEKQRKLSRPATQKPVPPKPPQNGYFIWGHHALFAALANNDRRVAQIYAASDKSEAKLQSHLLTLSPERNNQLPQIQRIDRRRLDTISGPNDKAVHQGMAAAVWPVSTPHLNDFLALHQNVPLRLLLLDQVSDPRNVGAIMRSAHAFGVTALVTTSQHAAEENGALARAASGALDHILYLRVTNLSRAIERLKQDYITVAGLTGDGDMKVASLGGIERLAIVLGAEQSGLRRLSRVHCDHLVRIDINHESDSLNVSNAAAVALYAASISPES